MRATQFNERQTQLSSLVPQGYYDLTHPRQLGPVLRSLKGIRDLVVLVELAGHVKKTCGTFKDGLGRPVLLDVHDGRYAPIGVD